MRIKLLLSRIRQIFEILRCRQLLGWEVTPKAGRGERLAVKIGGRAWEGACICTALLYPTPRRLPTQFPRSLSRFGTTSHDSHHLAQYHSHRPL